MEVKGHSGDISNRNEDRLLEKWREGDFSYRMAKNLGIIMFQRFVEDKTCEQ